MARGAADLALVLSVPIFIVVLCLMKLLVAGLEALQISSLAPLLLLQLLLLAGLFALCGASNHPLNSNASSTLVGAQLGVAAMAVQAALVQLSLKGAPSTTVMTTNITRFIMDVGDVLFGGTQSDTVQARWRARDTWPVILGFMAGAALGAVGFATAGLKALALPVVLSLLAFAMSLGASHRQGRLELK